MPTSSKKVAFHTLGCKLNFSESSTLAREFEDNGYVRVPATSAADVYVINTCSVTEHADKKCRNAIRKLIAQSPGAKVVVTGCYAQLKPQEVAAIPGVNLVVGAAEKGNLFQLLNNLRESIEPEILSCDIASVEKIFPAYSSSDRTRSFLKIQDGCDYHCTYCTIPLARGKSRNLTIQEIVAEAGEIARKGIKEIILTGVNIGDFGKSTGESFLELITALDTLPVVDRYRISSIEPNLLTKEIIDFVAHSQRFQPHFHIPLQSGSNKILGLMQRRYTRELFAKKIGTIKEVLPQAFLGIDIIVGFPGETEEEFMESYSLLEKLNVSFLHIFPYSVRPNTPAAAMEPKVSVREILERTQRLRLLSAKLHRDFYLQNVGQMGTALFERGKKNDRMRGYTGNYILVDAPYNKDLTNQTVSIKITGISENETAIVELI